MTTMEYSYLGNSGLRVSRLCLGTMTFSRHADPRLCNIEISEQILDKFVAAGGNFLDTADVYMNGDSERIIGSWLQKQPDRSKIVLATKLGSLTRPGDVNSPGLNRLNIIKSVEDSLERLQTPYIDLLYTHCWDNGTPLEETLETLYWLIQQGKVRYIGASNMKGWQVQLAAVLGKQPGLAKYIILQEQYNLLCRQTEWEVTEVAEREGIALLPWSPLKGGWLSGKMKRDAGSAPEGSRVHTMSKAGSASNQAMPNWEEIASQEQTWKILDEVKKVAEKKGKTVAQVAVRWLLEKKNVPSVVIGVKSLVQLEDNLGTMGWKLDEDEMAGLDKVSKPFEPYPYELINRTNKGRKQ